MKVTSLRRYKFFCFQSLSPPPFTVGAGRIVQAGLLIFGLVSVSRDFTGTQRCETGTEESAAEPCVAKIFFFTFFLSGLHLCILYGLLSGKQNGVEQEPSCR